MRRPWNPKMIRRPADEYGSERYNAHQPAMAKLLGISPTAHLPAEGLPPRDIQGWTVYVLAFTPNTEGRRGKSSRHRVRAICPDCKRDISAGRTHQHRCTSNKGV